jgi:hypothetical protein
LLIRIDQQHHAPTARPKAEGTAPRRNGQALPERFKYTHWRRLNIATVETGDGGAGTGGDHAKDLEETGLADAPRPMDVQHRERRGDGIVQGRPEKLDLR